MNCLEFRRLVEIQPDSTDAEFLRHKRECARCAEAAARAARFSDALAEAARVETPENLSSRILLKQSFSSVPRKRFRRRFLAMAASIVAAAGLAVSGVLYLDREDALAEEIFAVIRHADHAMSSTATLDMPPVARALAGAGFDLTGTLDKVTYAGHSRVAGKLSGHIVIQGELAPCSIFLIPDIRVAERYTIRDENLRGLVVPIEGGVLAIVGAPDELLAPVAERLKASVRRHRA